MNYFEYNQLIRKMYKKWSEEIDECFFSPKYSNIFCTGVPKDWFEKENRILVVGEETTWTSRENYKNKYCTVEIELKECQNWIVEDLSKRLKGQIKVTPFWSTVRKIYNEIPNSTIMWTEIDAINLAKEVAEERGQKNTSLNNQEREKLHSTDTRLLNEIVNIVKPSIIVFIGWHNASLKHESPNLYYEIYPNGNEKNNTVMKDNDYIFLTNFNKIPCILTYHPGWRKSNSTQYKNTLVKMIKEIL